MSTAASSRASPALLSRLASFLPWIFLAACFGVSVHFTLVGWTNPLFDFWSFRETQTAISVRSVLESGFRLDYATPVLGAPWAIPLEFPTYHFVVAALVKLTGLGLEPAGRLVSLLFGYGSFFLAAVLVARASGSRAAGIYTAALALVSPIYLYGSRAFMIESTALFFTLGMLLAVQSFIARPRAAVLVWLFLAATLAGLTKATTYAIGVTGVAGLLLVHATAVWTHLRTTRGIGRLAFGFALALFLSLALTLAWTRYTDHVKNQNELARFILSSALHDWYFGPLSQRLDLRTWTRIVEWTGSYVLGTPLTYLVGFAVVAAVGRARGFGLVLVATFASGVLVFTNLYFVHQHYLYANGIYLLALLGLGLGAGWDRAPWPARLGTGLVAAPLLAGLLLWGYVQHSLPGQQQTNPAILELAHATRDRTPPGSAIIVYGYDWDSALPYYAERHAIMDRVNMPAGDPVLTRALSRLDRPLGGLVFMDEYRDQWSFILQQIRGLGTGRRRLFSGPAGVVYATARDEFDDDALWRRAGFPGRPDAYGSNLQISLTDLAGRSAMLVHAPGNFVFARQPGQRTARFGFGLAEHAYSGPAKTDGVTFVVDFVEPLRRITTLYSRRLDPASVGGDRGPQAAEVELPDRPGIVVFRCESGPTISHDLSVWRDVELR